MENYEIKKKLVTGRTYDEVFARISGMLEDVTNGWEIAHLFSKLYEKATIANNEHSSQKMFFGIVQHNYGNYLFSGDDFFELWKKLKKDKKDANEFLNCFCVTFEDDAFLDEVCSKNNVFEGIWNTLNAYFMTNKEFLTSKECGEILVQLQFVEKFNKWESKYSLDEVFALYKAYKVANECSIALEKLQSEYDRNEIDKAMYISKTKEIKLKLEEVWLNKNKNSRCPSYFEDFYVPENLRRYFDEIYIDYEN